MVRLRGRVWGGRLVVEEPVALPDGEVSLVVIEGEEAWPPELDAELASRVSDVAAGRYHTLDEVLEVLRTGG